jgi:exopolyphosphatase/guanosine-5'-triphosphate,3'-diphosphate pyrophosphatase
MTGAPPQNLAKRSQLSGSGSSTGTRDSLRLAAIDIGSNSIHMIVAQADADGAVTTLWRLKEPVGLGRASFPSRRLNRVSMDSAIATLARFKQAAQQRQAEKIIAIATSAVREATNGGDLIERARRELGLSVRIVSARDEARLIYLAVRHAMPLRERSNLIVDIGGGSVEFIVGDARRAALLESRKLGAARMTARYVNEDPIGTSDLAALRRHYDRELTPLCEQIRALRPVCAIGTSGTLENIAAMCGTSASSNGSGAPFVGPSSGNTRHGAIERPAFEKLLKELIKSNSKERSRMPGLDDQRKDQIVAGAALVGELFDRLNLKRIHLCPSALREGVLLDYLSRHIPDLQIRRDVPDPRRRSVLDLARRCDWHKTHSEQVATICLRLFDELRPLHKLGAPERELIEYAAMLHDIGWHIGRKAHHKHSMYLIANGDLKNFTAEEVQVIANMARYHRKASPSRAKHDAYDALSQPSRRVVDVGAALLRLADGLDRSHASVIVGLTCRIGGDRDEPIRCTLTARSDAELEIWGARRKMKWFEQVFGRKISFALAKR